MRPVHTNGSQSPAWLAWLPTCTVCAQWSPSSLPTNSVFMWQDCSFWVFYSFWVMMHVMVSRWLGPKPPNLLFSFLVSRWFLLILFTAHSFHSRECSRLLWCPEPFVYSSKPYWGVLQEFDSRRCCFDIRSCEGEESFYGKEHWG